VVENMADYIEKEAPKPEAPKGPQKVSVHGTKDKADWTVSVGGVVKERGEVENVARKKAAWYERKEAGVKADI